jgi:hypothetical protein
MTDKSRSDRPVSDGGTVPVATANAGRSSRDRNAAAATNDPTSRWDLKTSRGRRCRDLYRAYSRQLGSPADAGTKALIMAAAEKVALAEIAREICFADPNKVTFDNVVRIESKATAALKMLKLDKTVSSKRAGPTLDDIKAKYATAAPATGEAGQ